MIYGTFGDDGELFFEIDLVTAEGLELPVDALLDTGFSEWLVINKQDISCSNVMFLHWNTYHHAPVSFFHSNQKFNKSFSISIF